MLLRLLRGEEIDWEAIEEKHTPKGYCTGCGFLQFKESFPPSQFSRKDDRRFCSGCVKAKKKAGTPFECANCLLWKPGAAFSKNVEYVRADRRVCSDCVERRKCRACGVAKNETAFTRKEWKEAGKSSDQGRCKECMQRNQETKVCSVCQQRSRNITYTLP